MVIKRTPETTINFADVGGTSAPQNITSLDPAEQLRTADINQIQAQYQRDAKSGREDGFDTGALLPKDMTVKLVRAESSYWEMFLTCFYSITLTLFGLFLGSWISVKNDNSNLSSLESTAMIAFGAISLLLIVVWIILKVRQQRHGIKIPYELLNTLAITITTG